MSDALLNIGLSNACVALAIALTAWVVGKTLRKPYVTHLLWLLVFVKLITPPLFTIPVDTAAVSKISTATTSTSVVKSQPIEFNRPETITPTGKINPFVDFSGIKEELRNNSASQNEPKPMTDLFVWPILRKWIAAIWLMGICLFFTWSIARVSRFNRLLATETNVAPEELQIVAQHIAHRLKIKHVPTIYTTHARLSPMVWWSLYGVQVIIPNTLLEQMDRKQWQWVLSHELAHVKRKDYIVRWIEWVACGCFWWNPIVWFAQHQLRAAEEICCDGLVLTSLKPPAKTYAQSLFTAIECLAKPVLRPPAMASEINSGGFLERRFKMILTNKARHSTSPLLQATVLVIALLILPFGLAQADTKDQEKLGDLYNDAQAIQILEKLEKGELSKEAAWREIINYLDSLDQDMDMDADDNVEEPMKLGEQEENIIKQVDSGTLSKEQAWDQLAQVLKTSSTANDDESELSPVAEIYNILSKEIASNIITMDEAWESFLFYTNPDNVEDDPDDMEMDRPGSWIFDDVEEGTISKAQGWDNLSDLIKTSGDDENPFQDIDNQHKALVESINKSELTKEQAWDQFMTLMDDFEMEESEGNEEENPIEMIFDQVHDGKFSKAQGWDEFNKLITSSEFDMDDMGSNDFATKIKSIGESIEKGQLTKEKAWDDMVKLLESFYMEEESDELEMDMDMDEEDAIFMSDSDDLDMEN